MNLLRNILQDGYIETIENNFIKSEETTKSFKLFDIESILNYYVNSDQRIKQKFEWYEECFYNIRFMNKNFLFQDI